MTAKHPTPDWTINRRRLLQLSVATTLTMAEGERGMAAASAPAANSWMYAGNPARTGMFSGTGPDLSKDMGELWRIDLSTSGQFVRPQGVCDNVAYYMPIADGVSPDITPLIAVDVSIGAELWRVEPPVTDPPSFFWGTPAMADGLLVIATYGGLLLGLDTRTGQQRWVFDVQGQLPEGNPALIGGVVYISDTASVNAIEVGETAEWLWKSSLVDGTTSTLSGTVSVEGDHVVVSSLTPLPGSDSDEMSTLIHVLNITDGTEAYRFEALPVGASRVLALQNGRLFGRSDHLIDSLGLIFSTSLEGTGRWSQPTSTLSGYPVVLGDRIHAVIGSEVVGFDAATGMKDWWQSSPLIRLNTSITIVDGVIFVGAATVAPAIFTLNADNGELIQTLTVPFDGADVVGVADGILIARSGRALVGLANFS